MQMNPYVSFKGDCAEAFQYYAEHLGGKTGELFKYGGSPMAAQAPAGWDNKIMHGDITIGGTRLMGADVAPDQYEAPRGVSLSLNLTDEAEADRMFAALSDGGRVIMPIEQTFWAKRFGVVTDRFGLQWLINCE
ncbi:MAG TPA: VOC family protein [Vicinamibacterales bacterium]|nr:VOC family protein [Vicinamibacterales bacterium]